MTPGQRNRKSASNTSSDANTTYSSAESIEGDQATLSVASSEGHRSAVSDQAYVVNESGNGPTLTSPEIIIDQNSTPA